DHFATAYDPAAFARLDLARAGADGIRAAWADAGFVDVQVTALHEVLELDRAHGTAPGHSPQLQHRVSARRARRAAAAGQQAEQPVRASRLSNLCGPAGPGGGAGRTDGAGGTGGAGRDRRREGQTSCRWRDLNSPESFSPRQ